MKKSQFEYNLPDSSIAHFPMEPRDASKLMVLHRNTGEITHSHFKNLDEFLGPNDILVLNQTKVFPARIFGTKETGGHVEVLLLRCIKDSIWEVLGRHIPRVGQSILFDHMQATVLKKNDAVAKIQFNVSPHELQQFLLLKGNTPLPPYIHSQETESTIRNKYQTVYAKYEGSVAAPTAGLHFTDKLLQALQKKGVQIEYVTLHVGAGTFLPIKDEDITKHPMHSEFYSIEPEVLVRLNEAKLSGKHIVSVGTTTTRVLETVATTENILDAKHLSGETNIFIYPPYKFQFVDALITNFHLPHSTLLALVSAFVSKPNTDHTFTSFVESTVGKAYLNAIENNYRFYSFGDGMMIG